MLVGEFKGCDLMYSIYGGTFTTEAGEDLVATIKTTLGVDSLQIRRLTIVHDSAAIIKLNGSSVEIPLYVCTDGNYRFETQFNEAMITSLIVKDIETAMYVLITYSFT